MDFDVTPFAYVFRLPAQCGRTTLEDLHSSIGLVQNSEYSRVVLDFTDVKAADGFFWGGLKTECDHLIPAETIFLVPVNHSIRRLRQSIRGRVQPNAIIIDQLPQATPEVA